MECSQLFSTSLSQTISVLKISHSRIFYTYYIYFTLHDNLKFIKSKSIISFGHYPHLYGVVRWKVCFNFLHNLLVCELVLLMTKFMYLRFCINQIYILFGDVHMLVGNSIALPVPKSTN